MTAKPPELVKEIQVKFLLPFSINLPNGTYGVKTEKFYSAVTIRKKLTRENASGMIGGMHIADDRFGLTNHTKIIVKFILANEIENNKISTKQLKQFSLDAINLILDQCRWQTNEYYNHNIVTKDFFFFCIVFTSFIIFYSLFQIFEDITLIFLMSFNNS